MAVRIIRKTTAPSLPPEDPLVDLPSPDFVPAHERNDIDVGPIPTLFRCVHCGHFYVKPSCNERGHEQCENWKHLQSKRAGK
jgi:hypothetical protein